MKNGNLKVSNPKGITLIALIITIIVLLILAGITINLTLGEDGIIRRAQEAGKNYIDAAQREQTQLDEFLNQTDKIIANVTGGTTNSGGGTSSGGSNEEQAVLATRVMLNKTSVEIAVGSTETLTATIAPDNASNKAVNWTTSDANVAIVENGVVTALSIGTATITAIATDGSGMSSSCDVTTKVTVDSLKAGDYIKYDTGVSTVGENGVITCRVLYPANSEYGLQIISDKNVNNVTLGTGTTWETGKTAYNNAIVDLNNYAEDYKNEKYANDVRCVGSLPTIDDKGMFIDKDEGTTTTVTLPLSTWNIDYYVRPKGWTTDDTGCYDSDENYTIDQIQMNSAGIMTTGESYWLASRNVDRASYCNLRICYVMNNGEMSFMLLCAVTYSGDTNGRIQQAGLRPCMSLKSDIIKITGGTGEDADNAYIIGL